METRYAGRMINFSSDVQLKKCFSLFLLSLSIFRIFLISLVCFSSDVFASLGFLGTRRMRLAGQDLLVYAGGWANERASGRAVYELSFAEFFSC